MTYYLDTGGTFVTATSGTVTGSFYSDTTTQIVICEAPDGSIVCTPPKNQVRGIWRPPSHPVSVASQPPFPLSLALYHPS